MDYKYIEQLMERYWRCETTLEEESILRTFFSQKDIPAELVRFRPLFAYQERARKEETLGDDFDRKMLSMTEETVVAPTTVRPTLMRRLMPLFKAAAIVGIVVTVGNAAQRAMSTDNQDEEINYASYKDTFTDPSVAYDKVTSALELVSEGISQADTVDFAMKKDSTLTSE